MKEFLRNWKIWAIACLTLGLAPFSPEPHILGKLRWIAGGGVGMQSRDWFDLLFHGLPWLLLIVSILLTAFDRQKKES